MCIRLVYNMQKRNCQAEHVGTRVEQHYNHFKNTKCMPVDWIRMFQDRGKRKFCGHGNGISVSTKYEG